MVSNRSLEKDRKRRLKEELKASGVKRGFCERVDRANIRRLVEGLTGEKIPRTTRKSKIQEELYPALEEGFGKLDELHRARGTRVSGTLDELIREEGGSYEKAAKRLIEMQKGITRAPPDLTDSLSPQAPAQPEQPDQQPRVIPKQVPKPSPGSPAAPGAPAREEEKAKAEEKKGKEDKGKAAKAKGGGGGGGGDGGAGIDPEMLKILLGLILIMIILAAIFSIF